MLHVSQPLPSPLLQAASDPIIGQIGHVTPMPHDSDQRFRENRVNPRRERKHPREEQPRQPPKDPDHKIDEYA